MKIPRRILRICFSAFCVCFVLFLAILAVNFRAQAFGADAFQLGLIATASGVSYILCALAGGALSDRFSSSLLAHVGALGFLLASVLIYHAPNLQFLIVFASLLGISGGFFWPPLEAQIGRESRRGRLEANLGVYNICWSTGMGLGFIAAGSLWDLIGMEALWLASGLALIVFFLYPWGDRPSPSPEVGEEPSPTAPPTVSSGASPLLKAAWIANFACWGIAGVLSNQYPKFLAEGGFEEAFTGNYLGLVYLFQALSFCWLSRWSRWIDHIGFLLAAQLVAAVSVLALSLTQAPGLILVTAPLIGFSFGLCFFSSASYSLRVRRRPGRSIGLHEAILGSGNFLVPQLGGLLATGMKDLRWPYWLAGTVVLATLALNGLRPGWRRKKP